MSTVQLEPFGDYVAFIRFNRPEVKHAINHELLNDLEAQIQKAIAGAYRCLVFTGTGDSFSAGADLKERLSWTEKEVFQFLHRIGSIFLQIQNLPMPTIASVNGYAFGGGLELALSCDLLYAQESAVVGLTETRLGIIPGAGGTQRLCRLVGEQQAKEWIFTGKKISAAEGKAKGLFLDVFPGEGLENEILKIANEISSAAPLAVRAAKKAIRSATIPGLDEGLEWERVCYTETLRSKDRKEALQAFKEKRKPNFVGE